MNVSIPEIDCNAAEGQASRRLRLAADLACDPVLMSPPSIPIPPFAVAGRVVLLTLGPKGGKSTTAAGLIANGSRDFGVPCGLLTLDEALPDSLQRLKRFGADLGRVFLSDEFDPTSLAAEVEELGLQVLVVDHLGKLAERSPDFGPNSQGDAILWGRLISPFTKLARELDLAVVLLDQARRSDGQYAGSTAKAGSIDVLAMMQQKSGGLVCTPRGRAYLPGFRVDLDPEGVPHFSRYNPGTEAPPRPQRGLMEVHQRGVLRVLCDCGPEGMRAVEWQRLAARSVGLQKTAFFALKRALLDNGHVGNTGRSYHLTPAGERFLARGVEPS